MPDSVVYRMRAPGSTRGAVTGRRYDWDKSADVLAPQGEFKHLPPGTFDVRPAPPERPAESVTRPAPAVVARPIPAPSQGAPGYSLGRHVGGGYYQVVYLGTPQVNESGEPVTVGQGKAVAKAEIERLNAEDK